MDEFKEKFIKKHQNLTFQHFIEELFGEDWIVEPSFRIEELKLCWNAAIENVSEAMYEAGYDMEGGAFNVETWLTEYIDEEEYE